MNREGDTQPAHMSAEEFRTRGRQIIDAIADYMQRVEQLRVLPDVQPGDVMRELPDAPPIEGESWDDILADAVGPNSIIERALTHWQSPNFFAFFPANSSYPGVLADLLSTGYGVQGMLWQTSPACTELEVRVLDWLAEMIGLPTRFTSRAPDRSGGGVIQGTASEATLVALVAARQRMRHSIPPEDEHKLVVYASNQAHSSVMKAAMIAGLATGPEDHSRVRLIDVDSDFAMRPEALAAAISDDRARGLIPCYVCATLGTTATTAIDPLGPIGAIARTEKLWLHVDAAYAGAACVCPEFRDMLDGVEDADSFCFNPHKWLLTNFDCNCLWIADRATLLDALSLTPAYLRNRPSDDGDVIDYRNWQIPLGRRFRALKLWFVIRHYGIEGLRAHIRRHVELAEHFEALLATDDRFEQVAERTLALVCFRLRTGGNTLNAKLLETINANAPFFLTPASVPSGSPDGDLVLRMSIGATHTQREHVDAAWATIKAAADRVCSPT